MRVSDIASVAWFGVEIHAALLPKRTGLHDKEGGSVAFIGTVPNGARPAMGGVSCLTAQELGPNAAAGLWRGLPVFYKCPFEGKYAARPVQSGS